MFLKFITENDKDTKADAVLDITFKPELETFEMSIMKEMGIEEDRVPAPTYWYWVVFVNTESELLNVISVLKQLFITVIKICIAV